MTPTARAVAEALGLNPEDKGKDLDRQVIMDALYEARIELGSFIACGAGPRTLRAWEKVQMALEVMGDE